MIDQHIYLKPLALVLALSKVGVHETGPNWGDEVREFLASAGIKSPAPWCAAFVNHCWQTVAAHLGVASPLEGVPLQGYVQSYVDHGRKHGWVVPFSEVEPGDLFTLYYPSLKRNGHIGIVVAKTGEGSFITVEGNTNDGKGREGNMVFSHTRPNDDHTLFLRPCA